MEKGFVFAKYVSELGKELVHEFNKAKLGTHPGAVGSNKEFGVIQKLQNLLPAGVGIGSGFIYDINGNVSKQCDIIIYEKDFCLVTTINGNEKDSFYNCESVIAVGEVKSALTKEELLDSLDKFEAINSLKRYVSSQDISADRQYLSKMAVVQSLDNVPVERNEFDRIFKFIICESMSVDINKSIQEKCIIDKDGLFNSIVSLDGKHVMYLSGKRVCLSPYFADKIIIQKDIDSYAPFSRFMYHLTHFIINGKTVPLNQSKYYEAQMEKVDNVIKIIDI